MGDVRMPVGGGGRPCAGGPVEERRTSRQDSSIGSSAGSAPSIMATSSLRMRSAASSASIAMVLSGTIWNSASGTSS